MFAWQFYRVGGVEQFFVEWSAPKHALNNQNVNTDMDWWSYIWGNPFFSSSKAYTNLICHAQVHQSFSLDLELKLSK
jgi:hypothetical protein